MDDFIETAEEIRNSGELFQEFYFTVYDYVEAVECKIKWNKCYTGSLVHQMLTSNDVDEKIFEAFFGTKKIELAYLIQFYDFFENVELPFFKQGIVFHFRGKAVFLFECEDGIKIYQYKKQIKTEEINYVYF